MLQLLNAGNLYVEVSSSTAQCYLEVRSDDCDYRKCLEICRPCYIGIGLMAPSCIAPSGPTDYWRCRCTFYNDAPCPPKGVVCPGPGRVLPSNQN